MSNFITKAIDANDQKEGTAVLAVTGCGKNYAKHNGVVISLTSTKSYTECNDRFGDTV